MPLRLTIPPVEATQLRRLKSKSRELSKAASSYLSTWPVVRGRRSARVTIRIDRLKELRSISPYSDLKSALEPLTLRKVRLSKERMFHLDKASSQWSFVIPSWRARKLRSLC